MRVSLASLALIPASVLALTITAPSGSQFWVANLSNTISWTLSSGDPASVDVIVTNSQNQTLNGAFSIARFLNTTTQSFTVTNVTLRAADSYQVVFVNPLNASQVYANSSDFSVKPAGTTPAPTVSASAAGASSTAPGSAGSTNSTSANASASAAAASHSSASAATTYAHVPLGGVAYALGACALASISAALL